MRLRGTILADWSGKSFRRKKISGESASMEPQKGGSERQGNLLKGTVAPGEEGEGGCWAGAVSKTARHGNRVGTIVFRLGEAEGKSKPVKSDAGKKQDYA